MPTQAYFLSQGKPGTLPLNQLHAPVLRFAILGIIRCDGRVETTSKRTQPISRNTVLRSQLANHSRSSAAAQIEVVVRLSLIVRMPYHRNFKASISGEQIRNLLQGSLLIRPQGIFVCIEIDSVQCDLAGIRQRTRHFSCIHERHLLFHLLGRYHHYLRKRNILLHH